MANQKQQDAEQHALSVHSQAPGRHFAASRFQPSRQRPLEYIERTVGRQADGEIEARAEIRGARVVSRTAAGSGILEDTRLLQNGLCYYIHERSTSIPSYNMPSNSESSQVRG